jgi:hypothetical protein
MAPRAPTLALALARGPSPPPPSSGAGSLRLASHPSHAWRKHRARAKRGPSAPLHWRGRCPPCASGPPPLPGTSCSMGRGAACARLRPHWPGTGGAGAGGAGTLGHCVGARVGAGRLGSPAPAAVEGTGAPPPERGRAIPPAKVAAPPPNLRLPGAYRWAAVPGRRTGCGDRAVARAQKTVSGRSALAIGMARAPHAGWGAALVGHQPTARKPAPVARGG